MDDKRLAQIKARYKGLPEVPWEVIGETGWAHVHDGEGSLICEVNRTSDDGDSYLSMNVPTAEFIAHARIDVPDLVAEVERLRALCAER